MPGASWQAISREWLIPEGIASMKIVLPPPQAAKYVGLSESYLAKSRVYGGPDAIPHVKLGARRVGYLVSDLDAWLAARRRMSTSDPGLAA